MPFQTGANFRFADTGSPRFDLHHNVDRREHNASRTKAGPDLALDAVAGHGTRYRRARYADSQPGYQSVGMHIDAETPVAGKPPVLEHPAEFRRGTQPRRDRKPGTRWLYGQRLARPLARRALST